MKHSASACTTIPAIIIRVILLIPVIRSLPNKFPHAISNAEIGIKNIPTFIEVIALRLDIKRVIKLTQQTTTNGFTLASPRPSSSSSAAASSNPSSTVLRERQGDHVAACLDEHPLDHLTAGRVQRDPQLPHHPPRRMPGHRRQLQHPAAQHPDPRVPPQRLTILGREQRQQVRLQQLKSFQQPYDDHTRGCIQGLKPGYYTRMGAAIRHAGPEDTITHICARFGVWDFGRFASLYRQYFGTLPAQSLKAAKALSHL